MLVHLFYLCAIWLILAFFMTILLGRRTRRGGFFSSLLYLIAVIGMGDLFALWLVQAPLEILIESTVALWLGVPLILMLRDWNAPGQSFFLFALIATGVYLFYAFAITVFSPLSPVAFIFSFLLFLLETAALLLSLTYAFEVLDVLCRVRWRRLPPLMTLSDYVPMVSLHVPAYNEPPELVEQTLRALAKLDYPRFEVILVDNNTPSEDTWQPLAQVCRELGFKCLHLEHWPGYKSGALNFALSMTDPKAEIVGVIDADYVVERDYLKRIVPYFADPTIAFVQAPQDYRDHEGSWFSRAAYDGYKYFFALSMPARNERNAIIFCGTMGLLRKQVLQEIGGWDEWCITEDAEASLRILNRGYKSLYVNQSFGRGLMPLNFEGLKKQRFRWAFGGVQILKKHWEKLMPWAGWVDPQNKLTGAQRYFYLVAGLQWFNELLTFAFTLMVLISAFLAITGQTALLRPTTEAFIILPLVLIGTNMLRALWGLKTILRLTWERAFAALTLWFSLTWVVALACVQAIVRKRGVFLRTPKALTDVAWLRALEITSWETALATSCVIAGLGALLRSPSVLSFALLLLCGSQALIYFSAPSHSLLSVATVGGVRRVEPDRAVISGSFVNENRLGMQIGLIAIVLLLGAFAASLWPAPTSLPWWSALRPQPAIAPPKIQIPPPQAPLNVVPTSTPGRPTPSAPTPTPPRPTTGTPLPVPSPTPSRATPSPTASTISSSTPQPQPTATSPPASTSSASPTSCPTPTTIPTPLPNEPPTPRPGRASPTPTC